MPLRHVVLFRVHDGVDSTAVSALVDELRALGSLPGITAWRVERSLDTRKGTVIVEDAAFVDDAAFAAFRVHPRHVTASEHASAIADWWVGDYAE